MSDMRTLLPAITEDDRQLLHYNPNTDDIVEWAQEYAIKAVQAWQACAARTVPEGFVVVPVEPTDDILMAMYSGYHRFEPNERWAEESRKYWLKAYAAIIEEIAAPEVKK
jgi:hypothetical protein